ncbi:LPD38 domain-containing protein [Peribacillus acanthi]|uniref:LPD38 domain-containing protein n=1 Tax=Peribacillus acanthi TaxID=2171554 RepID=UPI000D3E1A01|nr:LPD38 domain-containing protein [Peribacillus acanthi]
MPSKFDKDKYKKTFDQRFGAGAYDSGLSSARSIGKTKADAEIAKEEYKVRKKAIEKAEKEAKKLAEEEALYGTSKKTFEAKLKARGEITKQQEKVHAQGRGGHLPTRENQMKERKKIEAGKKTPEYAMAESKRQANKAKEKEQEKKKSPGFLDKLKKSEIGRAAKAAEDFFNPFDKISAKDAVNTYLKGERSNTAKEVSRGANRFVDSTTLGIMSNLDKKVNDRTPSYTSERKIGEGGGKDMISSGLGYIIPGIGAVKGVKAVGLGAKQGTKGLSKLAQIGKEGAIVGGAMGAAEVGIREGLNPDDYNWKQNAAHVGIGVGAGAVADPLLHGLGSVASKQWGKLAKGDVPTYTGKPSESALNKLKPKSNPTQPSNMTDDFYNRMMSISKPKPEPEVAATRLSEPITPNPQPSLNRLRVGRDYEPIESLANGEPPLIKVANANAKPVPKGYDSVQHIDNLISREVKPTPKLSIGQRVKGFGDRTYYNMFDDVYGLARLDKAKGKNVRDSDSAIATAHRSRGASAKAQQELERGFFDANGVKVGNSFTDILQQSKDPDKLETYLVAKGILDYDARGMVALKTDGLNQLELSNVATKQMELENPNIVQEAEEFYAYLKNQRNILKEGGIFNDAQIKQMEENNPNYVPMERVMDEGIENFTPGKEGLRKRFANVGNPVKKRTGSERQIISPFETTVKRQYVYNNMAERNKAGMAVLNHLRDMPEDNIFGNIIEMEENAALKVMKDADNIANATDNEIPEKINELFRAKEGDNNIIYVYENGNKYKIQVKDKMLFDSMMALDTKALPAWMNIINMPVRMLRAGITLSPDFALRNFLRDQLTTGVTSQKGYIPFYDAVLGASEIIKGRKGNSELINAYTRNGGNISVLHNIDRANTLKTIRELKGNVPVMEKLKKLAKDPSLLLEPLRKVGEFSEMMTRIGHMKRAVKKGETMEQAAYDARSTMDFNRAGAWGRQINQMTAFFNASLQGLDVLARSFKDQPVKTARNLGLYVVAPTVALYHVNKDQQWFKDLPEEERDKNWFINTGEEIIKLPKPFEAGILFGASVERGLDKFYNNEGGEFDGFIEEVAKTFVPELIPTAVKPLLEVYTNKNFFTGNAIDSMADEMLPAKDRYNAYNSQFAIKTADLYSRVNPNTEISPKDIDQLVRGYTGTLGTSVNEGIDALIGRLNPNIPERPDRGNQTTPFIRSLVVRNLEGNNKPTNDFYERFEKLRSMKKTQGEQFQLAGEKAVVEKTYKAISDLQKEKKDILNSTTLDGETKAQLIKDLNEQITEMARSVNMLSTGE